jgi:hypothetical protein
MLGIITSRTSVGPTVLAPTSVIRSNGGAVARSSMSAPESNALHNDFARRDRPRRAALATGQSVNGFMGTTLRSVSVMRTD